MGKSTYSKMTLKGDRALIRRLKKLEDLTKVEQVVQAAGQDVVRKARVKAPKRTEYMSRHIKAEKMSPTKVKIISPANYSGYVEYGTRYMRAQPFLRPAVKEVFPEFQRQLKKAVEDSR